MSTSPEPSVGDTLDARYRLVELVGTGGMAHVYRAEDLELGRVVAVKVMHARGAEQSGHDRIRGEVRLLASVSGHSLVTLYDAQVASDGPAYLVMEFVAGSTLAARLSQGSLRVRELDALAADLAEALHMVHSAGIVHRDVKPSNVLLNSSPVPGRPYRAKLADFGIAHLLDATRVTTPGLTVGTAAYIAPELLDQADPAPPSDIYALGLVLIEAATGRRAFGLTDARAQVLARLTRDPDVPASLGPERRELLTRMTSRAPGERPSADEVLAVLAALPPAESVVADEETAPLEVGPLPVPLAREDIDSPERTALLPLPASAPRPVEAAAAGQPGRRPRAALWVAAAAAAAVIAAAAWSVSLGGPPATDPTPTSPAVTEPPAENAVVDAPADAETSAPVTDGTNSDLGNSGSGSGNSGNGKSGGGTSGNGNSGNGNGNSGNGNGNSGNGNGNGKG